LKCELCSQETRINYGTGNVVICNKCIAKEEAHELVAISNNTKENSTKGHSFNEGVDITNPFMIGFLVVVAGVIFSVVMEELTRISMLIWSIYVFLGIFTTSVALIIRELKDIRNK